MVESTLVNNIIAAIRRRYGGFVLKTHGGMYQRTGMPDILWWYKGHSFGFEVKLGKSYGATELQKVTLKKMSDQGVHVGIVTSIDETMAIIERVVNENV